MLTLDPVVKVNVSVTAATASSSNYDVGLIVTAATETFTTAIRAKAYESLAKVAEDFAATSSVYLAAQKYFGVTPTPAMLVIGAAGEGESVSAALDAIRNVRNEWYGVYWDGASAAQQGDIDEYLNTINRGMQFATVTGAVATVVSSGLLSTLDSRLSRRTHVHYSAAANEAAAVMGEAMGCASQYADTTWQLAYKEVNGLTPATLTQAEVDTLHGANCSVYVVRGYSHTMLEFGATASSLRVDEVIALDRLSAEIQEACLALMRSSERKLPQNDTTSTRFMSVITGVLENFVAAGYIQPGIWRGASFGNIATGDALEKGYSLYADSFDNQSETNRRARKGMPIQVAICFCGSVESIEINVTVQE